MEAVLEAIEKTDPEVVGWDPAERSPGVMETGPANPSVPKCYK